jgi:hypothetical protein
LEVPQYQPSNYTVEPFHHAENMVQVVEHLPSKWEVLSLSPNTVKKKRDQ